MLGLMQVPVLTVVVVAANVLGAAMAAPQARKLLRTRRVSGVSLIWAVISAVVNGWWGVYGLGVGDIAILPVSVVSVLAYLMIAVGVHRLGPGSVGPALVAGAVIATVPIAAWWLGGWPAAGLVLGALYGVQLSPAVVAVYRAVDVSGVSVATWSIAFAEAVLWGIYGVARLDAGLVALATTGVLMSSLVLVRLFLRRPRRRSVAPAVGATTFATA